MHYDLLLRGGHVLDPESGFDGVFDIAIASGRIAAIEEKLPVGGSGRVIDVSDKTLFPGFIDFHTHVYWGGTPLGVNPDVIAPTSGVTTWVDAGSAGPGNFEGFYEHVIKRARSKIVAFLNLSYIGLLPVGQMDLRFGELFDFRLADAKAWLRTINEFEPFIAGVKLRIGHTSTGPNSMDSMRLARSLGDATGLPVMVHISEPPPLLEDVLAYLRAGDVVTHCYTPGLMGILDRHGKVKSSVREARDKGVYFDLGHGAGSFSFDVAEKAIADNFPPDIISSDLHAYNIAGPAFDLPTTLSKFLYLGMSLPEAIRRCTAVPASALKIMTDVGGIAIGGRADITIGHLETGEYFFGDAQGNIRMHDKYLVVDGTISDGRLLPNTDARKQGKSKPGLPYIDPRLTRPKSRLGLT